MPTIEQLYQLTNKNSLIVAGVISGTSADGIDVAFVEFKGAVDNLEFVKVLASQSYPYNQETSLMLQSIANLNVEEISVLNLLVAQDFANAITKLSEESKIKFDLVASHGQTIFHHSSGVTALSKKHPSTLQIGSGSILSVILNCPVVYDFRAKDMANGGQGAPLTPATDFYLYRNLKNSSGNAVDAILNLGGIGNITVFAEMIEKSIGFDTGPANAPIDRLVRIFTAGKKQFDDKGKIASSGKIDEALLKKLLANDTFVKKVPPKSSGFEAYGDYFVESLIKQYAKPVDADLISTVTAYVAHTVAYAVKHLVKQQINTLVVAGGGARNDFLMQQMQKLMPSVQVVSSDSVGLSSDYREAIAFALLGYANLKGFSMNLASITGAKQPSVLGCLAL